MKKQVKAETINVRVTPAQKAEIKQLCKQHARRIGTTKVGLSAFLRRCVDVACSYEDKKIISDLCSEVSDLREQLESMKGK